MSLSLGDYSLITMCLNTGTPKNINFSFETNGKLMALGVPILKHFRVMWDCEPSICPNLNVKFDSFFFRPAKITDIQKLIVLRM